MFKYIIILVIGAGVGWFLKLRLGSSATADGNDRPRNPNAEKIEEKQKNLDKVLEIARSRGEIANDDVERGLKVSDATAERYLQELEQQGKLEQIGGTGRQVRYKLK